MNAKQRKMIEELYITMHDSLIEYARQALENEALAEEAVQETFRVACFKADPLCNSPNPQGWIFITLKNTIANMKRMRANANKVLMEYVATQGMSVAFSEDKLSLEVTYENIAHLDEFNLIKELAVDGKSHLELANARGITLAACRKRIQRAKDLLKKKI